MVLRRKQTNVHACCSIPIGIVATLAILTLIPLVTSPFKKRFCTTGLAICRHVQDNHYDSRLLCNVTTSEDKMLTGA